MLDEIVDYVKFLRLQVKVIIFVKVIVPVTSIYFLIYFHNTGSVISCAFNRIIQCLISKHIFMNATQRKGNLKHKTRKQSQNTSLITILNIKGEKKTLAKKQTISSP